MGKRIKLAVVLWSQRFFLLFYVFSYTKGSLDVMVKLSSCDQKVMGLNLENSLLQKVSVLNKPRMLKSVLTCCKLYISESRSALALKSIDQASKAHPKALVLNKVKDEVYSRVGYTIFLQLAMDAAPIRNAVFDMVKAAFASINLELHSGSHPHLGVVDHICFHPLWHRLRWTKLQRLQSQ
ncbi:uncharacterized protein LOC122008505 [Zingiber officinale]|uniref:uncharacterized protein LOC122008505 n=1 Tax=Zingiber officinale TaxID=94328 RepID=UPI001C4B58CB|nr:uncharacterized protein LOC122008505 [Zingiber officinale]